MFTTTYPQTGTTIQDFTITDLQRDDTDEYLCGVNDPKSSGGSLIVATSNVSLSVYYFPIEPFPVCSPAGPITVDNGTVIYMQCSSETGNPAVMLMISSAKYNNRYTWTTQTIDDTTVSSLELTMDVTDDGVTFECIISSVYFPDMTRYCTIGPIMVRNTIEPVTELTTESTLTSVGPSFPSNNQQSSSNPWIIAFVVSTILLAASSSIIIIFIFRDIKHKREQGT